MGKSVGSDKSKMEDTNFFYTGGYEIVSDEYLQHRDGIRPTR